MKEYNKVVQEYITLNHMGKIETQEEKDNLNSVYLSHHAVIKEERETSMVLDRLLAKKKGLSDFLQNTFNINILICFALFFSNHFKSRLKGQGAH